MVSISFLLVVSLLLPQNEKMELYKRIFVQSKVLHGSIVNRVYYGTIALLFYSQNRRSTTTVLCLDNFQDTQRNAFWLVFY